MHKYLIPLHTLFTQAADPETAVPMKRYMRDQFEFLGLKSPTRKALYKQFLAENGLPDVSELDAICRDLWQLPQREFQYTAMDLLDKFWRKIPPEFIALFEYLIVTKSWWDTVDGLSSHAVGDLFLRYPNLRDEQINRWRRSDDFWLRRVTLIFQLRYKEKTDAELLFSLIEENQQSDEFFIQKAIGWALREYSKTNETAVIDFVNSHDLAPLSHKEALKWLARKGS